MDQAYRCWSNNGSSDGCKKEICCISCEENEKCDMLCDTAAMEKPIIFCKNYGGPMQATKSDTIALFDDSGLNVSSIIDNTRDDLDIIHTVVYLSKDDKLFINKLQKALYEYSKSKGKDPKSIVINAKQLLSILRYSYHLNPGDINYDTFNDIPLVCADTEDFYLAGENRVVLIKYLKLLRRSVEQ